jgi:hypothetical protein
MGLFDFLKSKSSEDKKAEKLNKIRVLSNIQEKRSIMQDVITTSEHDDSFLDENPDGIGEFGLEKTNAIPVNGIDNIPAYMDKLRYEYTSMSGSGIKTYNPIKYQRTTDSDETPIGSSMPLNEPIAASTSATNINGHIDVYNVYSIGGNKLAKIYINCYSLKTSNKVPIGLVHRDKIPAMQDGKVLIELVKKGNNKL